ncbi:uncharacterized protein BJ171DRAFT_473422 [Polychytrium aggregatum]|uniref:uncharacterized protein n=1 Tax=Polychytrium aggregatum TaxID=110093 RepID=UPI0022FE34E6|nr:uncharacterized protein BJ171DRAFT_473422 [Polychytrium aggregatum]KAI9206419.1 hypothetical protein BJ171DRAFT_473422 [Polychytrium aggregatum]
MSFALTAHACSSIPAHALGSPSRSAKRKTFDDHSEGVKRFQSERCGIQFTRAIAAPSSAFAHVPPAHSSTQPDDVDMHCVSTGDAGSYDMPVGFGQTVAPWGASQYSMPFVAVSPPGQVVRAARCEKCLQGMGGHFSHSR